MAELVSRIAEPGDEDGERALLDEAAALTVRQMRELVRQRRLAGGRAAAPTTIATGATGVTRSTTRATRTASLGGGFCRGPYPRKMRGSSRGHGSSSKRSTIGVPGAGPWTTRSRRCWPKG